MSKEAYIMLTAIQPGTSRAVGAACNRWTDLAPRRQNDVTILSQELIYAETSN